MSSPEREPPPLDDARAMNAELFRAVQDHRFGEVFAQQCARDAVSADWALLREMGEAIERAIFRPDGKRRTYSAAASETRRIIKSLCRRPTGRADVEYFIKFFDGLAMSLEEDARAHWRPASSAERFGFLVGLVKCAADRGITIHPGALPTLAKAVVERIPRAKRPSGSVTDFENAALEFARDVPLANWTGGEKPK